MSEKYIKELREHLFEIYKYRRNDRTLTYNMSIELLSRTCIALDYLQQEIERLNNIIDELEEEISRHIALCTDVTLNDILDKLKELKENKQLLEAKICNKNTCELQERIDKAIEYIENNSLYDIEYDEDIYENKTYMSGANDEIASRDLLDILKGSDKE